MTSPSNNSKQERPLVKMAVPVIILVLLLFGLFYSSLQTERTLVPSMATNKPVPKFTAKELFSDREISSDKLYGEYRLLNFWGSWCPACYVEHPYLMQLSKQGISIVGVNYKDTEDKAAKFLNDLGNPYEFSYFDPRGRIAIELGVTGAPETFLINPQGDVVYHRVGEINERIFNEQINPLMNK